MGASITGRWDTLTQADFEATHPSGGYLHFREQAPWQVTAAVRQHISDLADVHGWPLVGFFISGYGECPHFALHISEFPTQIGGNREEKLQNDINAMLEAVYQDIDVGREDPDDPTGHPGLATFLRGNVHVWNYDQQKNYSPRRNGVGDFALSPLTAPAEGPPAANWWQDM